jgi:SAM-dependent methyltransferase
MDMSHYDRRGYAIVPVVEGYGQWARTYENTVEDLMDLRLLDRLQVLDWSNMARVVDLACGTGRIGVWLKAHGVGALDGVDITPQMLSRARHRGIYDRLLEEDIRHTSLPSRRYDLAIEVLADEHLPDLDPLYKEAARLVVSEGWFVVVGYHPFFTMMNGIPTHFDGPSGEPVTIQTHVHLLSDHVQAGLRAGWTLRAMDEGLIDHDWVARKPQWSKYLHRPVSFAFAWQRCSTAGSI